MLALEWNLPFHIDLAARLAERYGWNFVYWAGNGPEFGRAVEARFPGIIFHDIVDARYGRPPLALADLVPRPFDEELAHALAYEETLALKMMDRIELDESFSYHERVRLYHRLVGWWSAALDHIQPDVMMIPTAPHVHYDFIVYALCRRRGIPTAIFENCSIPGLLLPTPVFEHGFPEVIDAYRRALAADDGCGEVALSPRSERYLATTRGTYVLPSAVLVLQAQAEKTIGLAISKARSSHTLASSLRKLGALRKLIYVKRYPAYVAYLKRVLWAKGSLSIIEGARRISGHYHGRFLVLGEASEEEDARHAEWVRRRRAELTRAYERHTSPPDFSARYVYVPLHVQPERSTSPNGGIYDHAELVIEAIARAIPRGWLVYVKEHPFQFAPWQVGERGRRVSDYQMMTSLPNVRLVPVDTKSFDLIDHARAVGTITGTSGWEAIARGVPVLCFGIAWYQGCDGVFDVRRFADLPAAIQAIEKGALPNLRRLRHFLNAVEAIGLNAYIDDDGKEDAQISEAQNIVAVADSLFEMTTLRSRAAVD